MPSDTPTSDVVGPSAMAHRWLAYALFDTPMRGVVGPSAAAHRWLAYALFDTPTRSVVGPSATAHRWLAYALFDNPHARRGWSERCGASVIVSLSAVRGTVGPSTAGASVVEGMACGHPSWRRM